MLYLFIYYFYYIWKKCPLLSLRAAKRYSAGASWWIPPTVKRRTLLISLGFSNGPRALSLWQRVLPGVQSSVQQACGPPALSSPRQHSHAVYPHWFHVKQEVWWHGCWGFCLLLFECILYKCNLKNIRYIYIYIYTQTLIPTCSIPIDPTWFLDPLFKSFQQLNHHRWGQPFPSSHFSSSSSLHLRQLRWWW